MTISVSGATGANPKAWSLTESLNKGWDATLDYGAWRSTRFADTSPVTFVVTDRFGTSLTSPTLLVSERGREHSSVRSTAFSLMDETSWLLSWGSESFDTFLGGTMVGICSALSDRFGVTISGSPTLPIYREDFKLTTGWAPLIRMARAAGKVLTVSTSGTVTFRDWDWTSGSANFKPSRSGGVRESYRPLDRFGKVFVTKNIGQGTHSGPQYYDFTAPGNVTEELAFPLGPGAHPEYITSVGVVGWVTLWDGPPDAGGQALVTHPLTGNAGDEYSPPLTGVWPATHLTAIVYPDETGSTLPFKARLKISGAPYSTLPAGIDGAISKEFGTGRGAPHPYSDSLISNLAHATSTWPAWLVEANRGTNMLSARGPFQCGVRVGQTWGWAPWGLHGRIEQVKHVGAGSRSGTEILVNCDVAA